jgi:endonuclease YncB( thermonuclease family)
MERRTHKVRRFLLGMLLASCAPLAQAGCPTPSNSLESGLRRVTDGDTLVLADGRHVRFIGIDAMELGHDGAADQPYAAQARDRLKQLIESHGTKLTLGAGVDRYDEHGRSLAYVFAGGEDLGLQLIREGLAVLVAVPPDLAQLDCYARAEAQARNLRRGIWSKISPLVTDTAHADLKPGNFLILRGDITGVVRSGFGLKLLLDGKLPLWIPAADLRHFSSDPVELKGHRVLVRGWLRSYRGDPELDVHAPQALLAEP